MVVRINRLHAAHAIGGYVIAARNESPGFRAAFELDAVARSRGIPVPRCELDRGSDLVAYRPRDSVVGAHGMKDAIVVAAEQQMNVAGHFINDRLRIANGERRRAA